MASVEEIQKRVAKAARKKLVKSAGAQGLGAVALLVVEFLTTLGATGMLGLALHLPYGVLRTAAAGFAGLTGIRYYLIPSKPGAPRSGLPHPAEPGARRADADLALAEAVKHIGSLHSEHTPGDYDAPKTMAAADVKTPGAYL